MGSKCVGYVELRRNSMSKNIVQPSKDRLWRKAGLRRHSRNNLTIPPVSMTLRLPSSRERLDHSSVECVAVRSRHRPSDRLRLDRVLLDVRRSDLFVEGSLTSIAGNSVRDTSVPPRQVAQVHYGPRTFD
jgi:hypothetical protein